MWLVNRCKGSMMEIECRDECQNGITHDDFTTLIRGMLEQARLLR